MPQRLQRALPTSEATPLGRRQFLSSVGAAALASTYFTRHRNTALAAARTAESVHGKLRVTDVEVHEIHPEYVDWIHYQLQHYYGPSKRYVYVVKTNKGITGLGESGGRESDGTIEGYIGTNPFDWIGDETSLGLGTAMYDLMGKAAGVPVYKLFGQKYRSWIPVGCWTVSTAPKRMAETVRNYAAMGYTWMKFHLSPFENILDQNAAMQAVAPKGFRVLYDVTGHGTVDHMLELIEKITAFPIAGAFEDPLTSRDLEGYIELRKRCPVPVILHHSPLGHTIDVLRRAADGYIVGHARIGVAMRRAGLFAAANVPFMLQNVGGHITRSMTTHMHAAFKTATWPFHSDAETWASDVVNERLEPVNGLLRVPEKPGLGVTLDRAELERLKKQKLPQQEKWIIKTRFDNGVAMYNIADPKQSIFMVRPNVRRQIPLSYDAPLQTEYWDNDGSPEYKAMFARLEREGVVLER